MNSTDRRSRVAAVADELASSANKVSASVARRRMSLATCKQHQTACKLEPPWCVGVALWPAAVVADVVVVHPFVVSFSFWQYGESAPAPVDPYTDPYNEPPPPAAGGNADPRDRDPPPPRGRSRSRSPGRASSYRRSPPPRRPPHAPIVCCSVCSLLAMVLTWRSRRPIPQTCWECSD